MEHLKILKKIEEQVPYPNMRIQWILTVPAIWSEGTKEMMRQAAEEVSSDFIRVKCRYTYVYNIIIIFSICPTYNLLIVITVNKL